MESAPGIPLGFFFLLCILAVLAQPGATLANAKAGSGRSLFAERKTSAPGLDFLSASATAPDDSKAQAVNASVSPTTFPDTSPKPPSSTGTAEAFKHGFSPASSNRCILFSATLCRAVHDKPVLALTAVQSGLLVSDGVTTRQVVRRGYSEIDPIARLFIGTKPTWGRMAPIGAAQVIAGTWLAERMRTSRHVWIRRFWWAPQAAGIAGNAWATGHNLALP